MKKLMLCLLVSSLVGCGVTTQGEIAAANHFCRDRQGVHKIVDNFLYKHTECGDTSTAHQVDVDQQYRDYVAQKKDHNGETTTSN